MKSATIVLRLATITSTVALAFTAINAQASALTPGDLLVYRVGDGSGGLSSTATAVFLDEYTPLGTLVQSIAVPTTGSFEMTAVGNDATEGIMSGGVMSASGQMVFTGYRADAGTANPSTMDPATVNRVIGTVGIDGVVNTSIAITDASGTIRSATAVGSVFYAGTSTGLRYLSSPLNAATTTVIDSRNTRQALLSGNSLFASSTAAGSGIKVKNYGNLPTVATAGTAAVTQGVTDTVNGFALFDLSSSVAGADTLYALNTLQNKLYKYTFDGTSWSLTGSISSGGAADITGVANGGTVDLFLTSGTGLYSEVDSSGYGNTITGVPSLIASPGANEAYRGLAVIPEPASLSIGLAAAVLMALRRRRS